MSFDPEALRAFEHSSWERAAGHYCDSFASATAPFVGALLDSAGVGAGMRVLDVACGPGHVAAQAKERGAIPAGLDFSPAMLAAAQSRYPAIPFYEGDAEALPFPDASFDAAVANFGIHHVPRPTVALREMRRVLHPGGRIAVSFWAAPAENRAWKLVFDAIERCGKPIASNAPPSGGGFDSPEFLEDALLAAGFVGVRVSVERRRWRHRDASSLIAALRAGTARMAALIEAQPASEMPAILSCIQEHATEWADGDGVALPIAAMIGSGTKA